MKRILLISLLLAVVVPVGNAQKAHNLREKYGVPDEKGRYRVRPNIGTKVDVSKDGHPARMVIKRLDAQEPISTETLMLTEEAEAVLAELVPAAERGQLRSTGRFAFGCSGFQTREYERVTIIVDTRCEAQGGGTYDAVVHWK